MKREKTIGERVVELEIKLLKNDIKRLKIVKKEIKDENTDGHKKPV